MNVWKFSIAFVICFIIAALTISLFIGLWHYGKDHNCRNINNPNDTDVGRFFPDEKYQEEEEKSDGER